ncbi:MAG: hypothetical protein NTW87_07930 [Planctomycetota bacterium]|nr:hypothetical protein [Planctomycetota bacterium]
MTQVRLQRVREIRGVARLGFEQLAARGRQPSYVVQVAGVLKLKLVSFQDAAEIALALFAGDRCFAQESLHQFQEGQLPACAVRQILRLGLQAVVMGVKHRLSQGELRHVEALFRFAVRDGVRETPLPAHAARLLAADLRYLHGSPFSSLARIHRASILTPAARPSSRKARFSAAFTRICTVNRLRSRAGSFGLPIFAIPSLY